MQDEPNPGLNPWIKVTEFGSGDFPDRTQSIRIARQAPLAALASIEERLEKYFFANEVVWMYLVR